MPTVLTDLAAGHTFPPLPFSIPTERARAYRAAAGDVLPLYDESGFVPPLSVAALALGALLEHVTLPDGTLHASESLKFLAPVPAGASVECRATLTQRSQRSGYIVSVIDSDIVYNGSVAVSGKATLLSPAPTS